MNLRRTNKKTRMPYECFTGKTQSEYRLLSTHLPSVDNVILISINYHKQNYESPRCSGKNH